MEEGLDDTEMNRLADMFRRAPCKQGTPSLAGGLLIDSPLRENSCWSLDAATADRPQNG